MKKIFLLWFSWLLCIASKSQSLFDTLSLSDKLYGLSTFWKEASYNFVFFDRIKINWDSTYQAYIPKVMATKNVYEYWLRLSEFASLLQDGHTAVGAVDYFWKDMGPSPVFLKKSAGKYFVSKITEDLSKDIPLGTEVLTINGLTVDSFQRVTPYNFLKGTILHYRIKTPEGLVADKPVETIIGKSFPKWVSLTVATEDKWTPIAAEPLPNGMYYIQLNTFSDASIKGKFDSLLPAMKSASAIIVDIRDNGGGNSDYARAIAEHLVNKNYTVGSAWKTRVHRSANKAWGSRILYNRTDAEVMENQAYFTGDVWEAHTGDTITISPTTIKLNKPVVVLMGPNTFSAAEDFLIFLDGSSNITTMGRASAGSSGQPLIFRLPHGMYGRVCAKRDTYPDGREFINIGIQPDIQIPRQPITAGNKVDYELAKAVAYLTESLKKSK